MNKKERRHMALLQERCDVLRARIESGNPNIAYIQNWQRELEAMGWAINFINETIDNLAWGAPS